MNLRQIIIIRSLAALLPLTFAAALAAQDALSPPQGRTGTVELGVGTVSDENFTFGRYNGWEEDGVGAFVTTDYNIWRPQGVLGGGADYLRFTSRNLGLDSGQGSLSFGAAGNYGIALSYDSVQQVNNFTGRTPFRGDSSLVLPDAWVASNTTAGMLAFDSSAQKLEQEVERERWTLALEKDLTRALTLRTSFSSEEKSGNAAMGAAIYIDASNGHAAILSRPVDQTTNNFDLALALYSGDLSLDLSYLYSSFENDNPSLSWQNPFDAGFGSAVDYPAGSGQMALEPDNELQRLRLLGSYRVSPTLRISVDGSYAETTQDDDFLPYTANSGLSVVAGLPRQSLDGEVTTSTLNAAIFYRPMRKLSLQAKWRFQERENDSPRDAYRYVRGDGIDQPGSALTVYNTAHGRSSNRYELEGTYRLPLRSRLQLGYTYEEIERENSAVEETEDDIYTVTLSTQPIDYLSARLEYTYSERVASTYHWDQAYLALFDSELINQIPDSQRFNNHPLLFQYHLANREQWQGKLNVSYAPDGPWSVSFDYLVRENEYKESSLGLLEDESEHATLSFSIAPKDFDLTAYVSYDSYDNAQRGRAFRGGVEKNPFEIFAPLPQASDPTRDWLTESEDETLSFGINLRWNMLAERLSAEVDFSQVDATGEQTFLTFGAPDLAAEALPDVEHEQQRLLVSGTYQIKTSLAVKFDYQFHHYSDTNWALDNVRYNTLDQVLWSGESNADDDIHFFQASVIYTLE